MAITEDRREEILEDIDTAIQAIGECNYTPEIEENNETKNLVLIASIAMNLLWKRFKKS